MDIRHAKTSELLRRTWRKKSRDPLQRLRSRILPHRARVLFHIRLYLGQQPSNISSYDALLVLARRRRHSAKLTCENAKLHSKSISCCFLSVFFAFFLFEEQILIRCLKFRTLSGFSSPLRAGSPRLSLPLAALTFRRAITKDEPTRHPNGSPSSQKTEDAGYDVRLLAGQDQGL